MDKLAEIRRPIAAELKEYRDIFEQTLKHENPLLRVALEHLLNRQGKMMRPMLVLLAAKFESEVNERVLYAAVSLELLHTASLVHDDVVDESDRRRGQKSVNALLDNKAAVLVGDFLLSKALYHAAATGSNRVVTWVSELGQTLADGELLQLANLDISDISEENYFEVISKKTASLFATCAKAGALLAGGGEEVVSELEDFGQKVGICFQMRDDLLDFDNQHDTGKPAGNDMKEGKLTLPVIHALLKTGNEAMRTLALKVRRGEASDEEINSLVRFTIDNEGLSYTEKILDKIAYGSMQAIRLSERNSIVADALLKFVSFVVGRDV